MNIKAKLTGALKSLTIYFNAIGAAVVLGLPEAVQYFPTIQPYVSDHLYKIGMGVLVFGNLLLRFRTSKGLDQK